MPLFSSATIANRLQFAEQQIDAVHSVIEQHPGAIPELYKGYQEHLRSVVHRLFVPNIKVDGRKVRATTPKEYQGSGAIGVVALHGGEKLMSDHWLWLPSKLQTEQQMAYLADHSLDDDAGIMQETAAIVGGEPIKLDRKAVAQSWRNVATLVLNENHQASFNLMSPLGVNIDWPQNKSRLLHEMDHLVETDTTGIAPNSKVLRRSAMMPTEQRGNFIELHAARYMLKNQVYVTPELVSDIPHLVQLDQIREDHLGEGPQFGYSTQLEQAYKKAGALNHILGAS